MVEDLLRRDCLALTAITVFELYAGISGTKRLKHIDRMVSLVPILAFELSEALVASQIYNELRQAGTLIGNQDIFIAAVCLVNRLPLLTRNTGHFSRVPKLMFYRHGD